MSIFDKIAKSLGGAQNEGQELGPIESPSDQTPEEIALVSHIREKIDSCRQGSSRITQEGIAFTNTAYLLGYDGVVYDTSVRQFKNVDPKRKLSRNRFKINKILPTVQNRLARLTQSPPKYDVKPKSNSSEDKDAARLGLQVIEDIFSKQNFPEKQQEVLMCAMQGGVAYLQGIWDPTLGAPMTDPESGEIVGYEGDVRIEVLNMLEVFPDPLAKSLDDAQWVIKAKVRKLDYFKERYGDRGLAVKEEDVWLLSSIYDLKSNGMSTGMSSGGGNQTSAQMKNSAIELVYYEKRSKEHPNGRMVVCGSGILLEDKELPIGEFDIVKFDDVLIGGRYHSEAIITHLRPIQDQYNILRTKCADWVKQTLAGKYIVAKGAGLSQESLNNQTEVIEANAVPGWNGPVVTQLMTPAIPQWVYEDLKVLDQEFDFVSGINEVSRGVTPGSSMPFRGLALLAEQDQTRISTQTKRNEVGYSRIGCVVLKYVGKNYVMPRLLKTAGDGLEYAVKEFQGSQLHENYDVVVVPDSTVPSSKTLKRQDIINLYQMGLLGNPQDPKLQAKVLKIMEYGDVAEVWKEQALDEQQVKKAIDSIEQGQMPNPIGHEWDNHEVFIRSLNEYRKTDKFDDLSEQQKQMFTLVSEWHVQALVNLNNPQIPQQQLMAQHMVNTMQQMKGGSMGGPPQAGASGVIPPAGNMPGVGAPPGAA
jgi:hypothetical protein